MKIIFLDFDGVLNNAAWIQEVYKHKAEHTSMLDRHSKELDPTKVKMISDLAVECNASIVVSSSWRLLFSVNDLIKFLQDAGLDPNVKVIGATPSSGKWRGQDIIEFFDIFDRWFGNTDSIGNY